MGFFDSLFKKKPSKSEITAFNYYLFFDYIPKQLYAWEHSNGNFKSAITYHSLVHKNTIWESLVKKISITDSTLRKYSDITLYLIQAPSNEAMGEVTSAIIAVNPKIKKYLYYTLEYTIGGFAICSCDEKGNHGYCADCNDGNEFGAFVIKSAQSRLVAQPKVAPKVTEQPKHTSQPMPPTSAPAEAPYTPEKLLKSLENLASKYYEAKKIVSLEDWLVTQKVGNQFIFSITQYPDEEFDKPNTEVTLMVEVMDHNGRLGIIDKFFPKKETKSSPSPVPSSIGIPNIIGKHYSLDNLRQIPMGDVRLQPIDFGLVFNDQALQVIQIFAEQSPRIKKYLPNLDLSSLDAMRKYFANLCKKTELGYEFGYALKMNRAGDNGVIGFVFVHTPSENEFAIGLTEWTIDFCLFEPLEGKGIMRNAILRVLNILKNELDVSDVYAVVDENNSKCIKLLHLLPFDCKKDMLVDHQTGNRANLFHSNLTTINFQRR
ncbi:MAG: GNAT family N-acetyltransferase [Muribaculum sp.]|nr:GNAT family N-acetyltransferase [Muribaculum sp.]